MQAGSELSGGLGRAWFEFESNPSSDTWLVRMSEVLGEADKKA